MSIARLKLSSLHEAAYFDISRHDSFLRGDLEIDYQCGENIPFINDLFVILEHASFLSVFQQRCEMIIDDLVIIRKQFFWESKTCFVLGFEYTTSEL